MEKNDKKPVNAEKITPKAETELLEKQAVERSQLRIVWLAIIIMFILVAGAFWFLQQQLSKQQEPVAQIQDSSLTEQLEHKITQLKQIVMTDTATTEQRLVGLDAENLALLDKVDELAKAQTLTNDDVLRYWIMAELKFLLQSANQSILLAGDVDKARVALKLANQQLQSLTDPRLHALREIITDEQLALASVAKVDIDGLAMQLQSALNKIDDLQVLMGPQLGQQKDQDALATSLSSSSVQTALSNAWQEIKSLVVIRHQQDAAVAVLVPEQRYFLYQNLRLKLESARLGLLSSREMVFHDNLASAEQWLQHYFIGSERDAMLDMLKTMQLETITVEMPDISASLIWLQQYGGQ